ncbi:hypothetical protein SELMODRAFT_406547 [Selaginella moellendorffii]|uniref:Uncharacterized protein n=1 Tax=Selaginella moellendorffii TaxID=88036 RepID=D8R2R2_SELML|nr:hypothetical protein SELMODRAFT_406547 [Selaginella moellendorffii]
MGARLPRIFHLLISLGEPGVTLILVELSQYVQVPRSIPPIAPSAHRMIHAEIHARPASVTSSQWITAAFGFSNNTKTLLCIFSHIYQEFPYQNRHLFFKPPTPPFSKIITHMKQPLAAPPSEFYPVAGRISVREDMRMQLECNDHGVMFSEASCDRPLPKGDKFDLDPEFLLELSQAPGTRRISSGRGRLMLHAFSSRQCYTFKVSEFSYGGFCVAMKYSHELMSRVLVGDGHGTSSSEWANLLVPLVDAEEI